MAVTLKGYTANYLGLSTDAKPTEADDNAIFRELDTGKRYYFTGAAWAEIPSSGGGGGGDVTSVNGKTGAVTLTASDVGAYTTAETDALLGDKQSKTLSASVKIGTETETTVEGAIGEVAAIIPATAAVSNKLSTAADTAKEDITATANSEDIVLTDAADARVHDLRIYGKTVDGHSVGENGLTVTARGGKNLFNINGEISTRYDSTLGEFVVDTAWNKNDYYQGMLLARRNLSAERGDGQLINVIEGQRYTLSCVPVFKNDGSAAVILIAYIDNGTYKVMSENIWTRNFDVINTLTFAAPKNQILIVFGTSAAETQARFRNIQLEKGNTYTEYAPYISTNVFISTSLPLRGSYKMVDLGALDWAYQTAAPANDPCSIPRFYSSLVPDAYIPSVEFGVAMSSCSSRFTPAVDPVLGGNTDKTICFGKGKGVYIVDHDYTDAAAFKAAVTGITLTYPSYCDEIDLANGVAITRLDSNGDVLATPVTTPLSDAEKAAFAEFRTFDGNTNVTATDDPFMSMVYVKNTDNGKALANVDNRIEETFTAAEKAKLAGIATGATANTVIDTTCTLTVAGWTGAAAPYTQTVNVVGILATDRPILDIAVSNVTATGIAEVENFAYITKAETGAGSITFSCYEDKPDTEMTINIKVVR